MMSPDTEDRSTIGACAALLEQGRILDGLSRLLTAVAVGLLFAGAFGLVPKALAVPVALIAVAFGLAETRLAIRVGFDAALLRDTAHRPQLAALDAALVRLGLIASEKAGRPLEERLAGAMRLMRRQGLCLAGQIGVLVLGALVAAALQGRGP